MVIISTIYHFLGEHPLVGIVSGFGSTAITFIEPAYIDTGSFVEPMTEVFKFIGSGLGVLIAMVTLYAKGVKIRKKNKDA